MKITQRERTLYESSATLSNVVHACVLTMGKISPNIPHTIDGVEYTYENLAEMLTVGILAKLEEKKNARS